MLWAMVCLAMLVKVGARAVEGAHPAWLAPLPRAMFPAGCVPTPQSVFDRHRLLRHQAKPPRYNEALEYGLLSE